MTSKLAITTALVMHLLVSGHHGQASPQRRDPDINLAAAAGGSSALKEPSASAALPTSTGVHGGDNYSGQDEKLVGPLLAPVGRHIARRVVPKHIAHKIPKYVAVHCFNVAVTKCYRQMSLQCFKDALFNCS